MEHNEPLEGDVWGHLISTRTETAMDDKALESSNCELTVATMVFDEEGALV